MAPLLYSIQKYLSHVILSAYYVCAFWHIISAFLFLRLRILAYHFRFFIFTFAHFGISFPLFYFYVCAFWHIISAFLFLRLRFLAYHFRFFIFTFAHFGISFPLFYFYVCAFFYISFALIYFDSFARTSSVRQMYCYICCPLLTKRGGGSRILSLIKSELKTLLSSIQH